MRLLALLLLSPAIAAALEPCRIDIVDADSGWPVPLVELRTTHQARFVSDNAGVIAFDLPELMGVETWFHVRGHGYGIPADGFGNRGVRLTPTPGGRLQVKVQREIRARRLGRLTGAGLFGESQQLGLHGDWKESGIMGCDSVLSAAHRGRLYWAWGDSHLPHYPLGIFHASSATTSMQPLKSFEPPLKVEFDYFRDQKGRPRGVAEMPGKGPTWLSGYLSLPDKEGTPRLCAHYVKVRGVVEEYEAGLCVWNRDTENFERLQVLWRAGAEGESRPARQPTGHPVLWTDAEGEEWVLFGDPFPHLKCRASFEAWKDPDRWQELEAQREVPTRGGDTVAPHRGSIAFSEGPDRWVSVFVEKGGEASFLGEVWFAVADAPTGPWRDAVKVASHDNYSFYNVRMHPELTADDAPFVLFEGTYTTLWADRPEPTPRHEYNQVLYRLDFADLE